MRPWEPELGPPVSFFPNTTMAWSCPYLAILTSAGTAYKEAKSNDAKAKILAATVKEIVAKAKEDSHALPDDLKNSACLCLFYTLNRQGPLPIENTDVDPQLQQATSLCQSHPTHGKFFQSPTATWRAQIPQDISSERRSRCAICR